MGVNNRKRRAAKQRKQERARDDDRRPPAPGSWGDSWDAETAVVEVEQAVRWAIRLLGRKKLSDDELAAAAHRLQARVAPHPRHVVEIVLHDLTAGALGRVVTGGWSPRDLAELVTRNLGATHLTALADGLRHHERMHPRGQAWRDAIDAIDGQAVLHAGDLVASLLGLVTLLQGTPVLTDAVAAAGAAPGPEHPKLAQVRALLAKAESTEFDAEAEALSAKAQELIARYALDQLLVSGPAQDRSDLQVRRIWLDAPYVRAKLLLVSVVASANRCRAASADRLGFSVVVGAAADLHAVELLVTSLLVQADAAMLRHGRRTTASGAGRTKSFRQSFLTAYATRIGQRLAEANAVATSGARADLLPVVRSQELAVAAEFDRLVPHTVGRAVNVSNGDGWVAGLAAADVAALDVQARLARSEREVG